uniref:polynucleotide adenylyltransferase n=2 Tax=Meloidogyne TaxID=189290 RepID=A0A6V7VVC9_MELEN|nr:unnamed protein product [Meloidogyne enterolobii]
MLTKVFLLYPRANFVELVERFFIIFATWNWQIPLRINNPKNIQNFQQKNEITVYSPTYPEIQLSAKITKTNLKIIVNSLLKGLDKLYYVTYHHKNKNMINESKQKNIGIGFMKMYKIFIVISCISKMQVTQEQFCSFIESKLYNEIEQLQQFDKIDYCHIGLKTEKCERKFNQKNNFCTSWLLGIRFNEQIDKQMSEKFNEKVQKIKEELVNQFVFRYIGSKIEASSQLEIFGIKYNEIKNWGFIED